MLKISWNSRYVLPLPENHRFPMIKYELLPEQLLHEGTITTTNLHSPALEEHDAILLTHHEMYWNRLKSLALTPAEIRRTGFPLSQSLVDREVIIMNGTLDGVRFALQYGIAMNLAGGTHHAFTTRGEGFCLLNDQAIGAVMLLQEKLASKVLIVDLDVHQGNGTAEIFANNSNVFTFSMHGANNYPLHKEASDLDVELPDYTNDVHYLDRLDEHFKTLLDTVQPDFIFYQSGVDILDTDKLGRLSVTRDGCAKRDRLVLSLAKQNKIPIMVCMGGGYSPNIKDIVEAHANTYRIAQDLFF